MYNWTHRYDAQVWRITTGQELVQQNCESEILIPITPYPENLDFCQNWTRAKYTYTIKIMTRLVVETWQKNHGLFLPIHLKIIEFDSIDGIWHLILMKIHCYAIKTWLIKLRNVLRCLCSQPLLKTCSTQSDHTRQSTQRQRWAGATESHYCHLYLWHCDVLKMVPSPLYTIENIGIFIFWCKKQ